MDYVHGAPNRNADMVFRCQPCHDVTTLAEAAALRVPITITPVTASALIALERRRQIEEEGFTPEHDAQLPPGQLGWMVLSIVDRAMHGERLNDPPTAWPVDTDRWPMNKTPVWLLTIAAALLDAEIETRLGRGERP